MYALFVELTVQRLLDISQAHYHAELLNQQLMLAFSYFRSPIIRNCFSRISPA